MARNSAKTSGSSRIRFVMLEAEIEDGDFSQITQAIQNALGPRKVIHTQILRSDDSVPELSDETLNFDRPDLDPLDSPTDGTPLSRNKPPSKRSFPTPEVVDVNWNVQPSVEEFVTLHPPKSTTDKYLVVLSWFKEAAGESAISTNQVYTVFRKIKWPTAIKDFSQPLRDLKGQQLITGNAKQGFSINHLGLARVEEMKS